MPRIKRISISFLLLKISADLLRILTPQNRHSVPQMNDSASDTKLFSINPFWLLTSFQIIVTVDNIQIIERRDGDGVKH